MQSLFWSKYIKWKYKLQFQFQILVVWISNPLAVTDTISFSCVGFWIPNKWPDFFDDALHYLVSILNYVLLLYVYLMFIFINYKYHMLHMCACRIWNSSIILLALFKPHCCVQVPDLRTSPLMKQHIFSAGSAYYTWKGVGLSMSTQLFC